MRGDEVSNEELAVMMQSIKIVPGVQLVTEMTNEKENKKRVARKDIR